METRQSHSAPAGKGAVEPRSVAESVSAPDQRELKARLEALAEFAAGAGHEINNPVATIVGHVQLLLAQETDPERRQMLATIGGQALRIRDMIGDVMLFARPPKPQPEQLDLVPVVEEILQKLSEDESLPACDFELEAPEKVPILADPTQLRVVIASLVRNSLEAQPQGGVVRVLARSISQQGRNWTELSVSDAGSGLSETDREHLFDPFYSGRQAGRGLGFGLCKCWQILNQHGGSIEFVEQNGSGVTFATRWPR